MSALAILAFLVGAVLAFRFSVLVLYPLIAAGTFFGGVLGLAAGHGFWTVALAVVAGAVALQAGYAFGAVGRMSLVMARYAARRRARTVKALPRPTV